MPVSGGGWIGNGLTLYRFRYLWSDTEMVDVMAQQVLDLMPDAVITGEDGFYRVKYDMLGISMMTFEDWKARLAATELIARAA